MSHFLCKCFFNEVSFSLIHETNSLPSAAVTGQRNSSALNTKTLIFLSIPADVKGVESNTAITDQ